MTTLKDIPTPLICSY